MLVCDPARNARANRHFARNGAQTIRVPPLHQTRTGPWFRTGDLQEFTRRYNQEILGVLDPEQVVRDLHEIARDHTPTLLCWEPPEPGPKWCHRGLVAVWLYDKLGLEVFELGQEQEGCGHAHPKLHPAQRNTNRTCYFRN